MSRNGLTSADGQSPPVVTPIASPLFVVGLEGDCLSQTLKFPSHLTTPNDTVSYVCVHTKVYGSYVGRHHLQSGVCFLQDGRLVGSLPGPWVWGTDPS